MRSILFCICMLFASILGYSQESNMPKLDVSLFSVDHSKVDTAASGIVLYEYGRTELQYLESDDDLKVIHHRHVRIKIFNKDKAEEANISIPLYKYGKDFEYVREIEGTTYNLEGGKLVSTALEKGAIFTDKGSQYHQITKFTMPNIKDNSIIEFSYRIISGNVSNFRTWNFQSAIPKIYSEYVAVIPANFEYNVNLKGHYKLTDMKTAVLSKHFLLGGIRNDCSKMTYIMKDLPAFHEEPYMLATKNYISSVNFELKSFHSPSSGRKDFTRKWEDISMELMNEKEFGGQVKNKGAFKDILPQLQTGGGGPLDKAKAIYSYIQKNISWNNVGGKYAEHGVKKALELKKGNIADINLSLVAALTAADLEAYPVIIATREEGIPGLIFPVISDFNSVICLVKIDGKDYLLDATEKNLPFGELSLRSINYKGRVIYSNRKSDWIDRENKVTSKITYNILGVLDSTGKLKATVRMQMSGLEAFNRRKKIEGFPTLEEYEENVIEKSGNIRITGVTVENLSDLNFDLVEKLDLELDFRTHMVGNQINLNPILYDRTIKNPFNLEDRQFHVDLGAPHTEVYNINITLPQGYTLKNGPKNSAMSLPETAARYVYRSAIESNLLMVQQTLNLNKAIYSPEEYFHLKEFFSRIIQQQNMVFQFSKL